MNYNNQNVEVKKFLSIILILFIIAQSIHFLFEYSFACDEL
jgi:hypothetical protein